MSQVNRVERSVPFDNGELKAYQVGNRLIIITLSGVEIDLSSTQYLKLTVPQVYDSTALGLCGDFNGDRYDDSELRNGHLGHYVSLPHIVPSGGSLSSGVNHDKSEILVILRKDAGMESELEIEIGVTMVTARVPLWYSGQVSVETLMTFTLTLQ